MGIAKISGRERALQYEKKGRGHEQETHYFHGNDFGRSRGTGADDGLVSGGSARKRGSLILS